MKRNRNNSEYVRKCDKPEPQPIEFGYRKPSDSYGDGSMGIGMMMYLDVLAKRKAEERMT